MLHELKAEDIYPALNTKLLNFETTQALPPSNESIGQQRAIQAIHFFTNVQADGYNLFCVGADGIGKQSLVLRLLKKSAPLQKTPQDWCYVNNFEISHKPKAVCLPAGRAPDFAKDVHKLIKELTNILPKTFSSASYKAQVKKIEDKFQKQKTAYFDSLQSLATGKNVSILRMPVGLVVAPTLNGEVLTTEAFDKLPDEKREQILQELNETQKKLEIAIRDVPKWEQRQKEELSSLEESLSNNAISHLIDDLKSKYGRIPSVKAFIKDLNKDILENIDLFIPDSLIEEEKEEKTETDGKPSLKPVLNFKKEEEFQEVFNRYKVNVLVTHKPKTGAPITVLTNPKLSTLVGRMERVQKMGILMTDFSLIKAGALHEANGGYLIIEAKTLLQQPQAWESLKRALSLKKIHIEAAGDDTGVISTTILEPEPIDLNIKVVLIGTPDIYYTLSENDPDFSDLFKVEAYFTSTIQKTNETIKNYATLLGALARDKNLFPLTKKAVAHLIAYSSRLSEDKKKLTTHFSKIIDVIQEANYFALLNSDKKIKEEDISQAILAKNKRSDRVQENLLEQIKRGVILIKTDGMVTGQINGLAVHDFGNFCFGRPSRITCQVSIGKGEIVNIEREVDLSGSIHSKGVFILTSLLNGRFGQKNPLSLDADIVFEQSYGEIDGDSASCAEFYCLMSAIGGFPLKQSIAVTGSLNQFGEVQAVGGVNEKVEGFFDVCQQNGLTGEQGVILPLSNKDNLILRPDVARAVKDGQFHIYGITHVDDGLEILSGLPAGSLDENDKYPENSVNGLVEKKLMEYFNRSQEIAGQEAARKRAKSSFYMRSHLIQENKK
jgi:lon-related putative ATP-dependent protease